MCRSHVHVRRFSLYGKGTKRQRLQLVLAFLALLVGCRASTRFEPAPSVWSKHSIQTPADARTEVATSMSQGPCPTPQVSDPRAWSRDDTIDPWQLGLAEALAIAMTNSPIVRVLPRDRNLEGATLPVANRTQTDYDALIEANRVEAELGRFDAILDAQVITEPVDNPLGTSDNGTTRRPASQDRATIRGGLRKPTIYGGEAALNARTDYRYVPPPNRLDVNPQYQPEIGMEFRQALLQNAGQRVNLAPVVIVAAEAERSAWELHDAMLAMTRSIETTYWALYNAKATARAIQDVLPMLHEVVRLSEAQVRADVAIPADAAQAKSELLDFERQYAEAVLAVRNQEALLLDLLGLPPDPSRRINLESVPPPKMVHLDWQETLETAMRNRPDIMRKRLAIYVAERATEVAENQMLPKLDAVGGLRVKGLGDDLGAALELLGDVQHVDWLVGLAYRIPVGNHTASAELRSARLLVNREHAQLQETVHAAVHELSRLVFEVDSFASQYGLAVQARTEVRKWLHGARARYMNPTKDVSLVRSLDLYLRAIRDAARVDREIARLTAQYHTALTRLEEAKGTLLARHNIVLYDDPMLGVQRIIGVESVPGLKRLPPIGPAPPSAPVESLPAPPLAPVETLPAPRPADSLRPPNQHDYDRGSGQSPRPSLGRQAGSP